MYIVMNASHDQVDCVDRARLVESCGARDDSPSWNLGRANQGDTIRVGGMSPGGRGQKDVKESEQEGASDSNKERGRMQDQGERRECDETSRQRREF